ncbi:hypothetical protein QUF63_14755, partial [Anaerolineales bacterium HSG25]|nr:hypothetical protein [Anaerolineales bacterium HSG25]
TPTPRLRQLTSGECCVRPFFSPDNRQVLFIDKPTDDAPTGIYGVEIESPQTPVLINQTIGFRNHDRTVVTTIGQGDFTNFTNEVTGESWQVDTKGNRSYFSPDGERIRWHVRDEDGPYDQRQVELWIADLDGSNTRFLTSLYGGSSIAWFADNNRILLVGKNQPADTQYTLYVYDISADELTALFTENRLREIKLSDEGSWVVFYVTYADDPTQDGLWLVSTDGQIQRRLDLPGFGAYQWQDDQHLVYIPMREAGEVSMTLMRIDVTTGEMIPLTNPDEVSFSIANGDWQLSSDGRMMVFVNSNDFNLWLLELGE